VPTVIDLFAGCGGLTAGFVRHGYTPVLAVEHNLQAAATSPTSTSCRGPTW
jgi:DNA (cytosine-5)-methyltransferase 1